MNPNSNQQPATSAAVTRLTVQIQASMVGIGPIVQPFASRPSSGGEF